MKEIKKNGQRFNPLRVMFDCQKIIDSLKEFLKRCLIFDIIFVIQQDVIVATEFWLLQQECQQNICCSQQGVPSWQFMQADVSGILDVMGSCTLHAFKLLVAIYRGTTVYSVLVTLDKEFMRVKFLPAQPDVLLTSNLSLNLQQSFFRQARRIAQFYPLCISLVTFFSRQDFLKF